MRCSSVMLLLLLFSLFCVACQDDSAHKAAKKLCACSKPFVKLKVQYESKLIDKETMDQASQEHLKCMGTEDPLKALENDPEAMAQFKIDFLTALQKECPEVARNMDF